MTPEYLRLTMLDLYGAATRELETTPVAELKQRFLSWNRLRSRAGRGRDINQRPPWPR